MNRPIEDRPKLAKQIQRLINEGHSLEAISACCEIDIIWIKELLEEYPNESIC